ncbi:MAG: choice-of-anchor D domain-containing protein [Elusimicrobiales bacterium]|nr:choice-of-anchor D domain-containing protein [Elusimicrobiales bacterium]
MKSGFNLTWKAAALPLAAVTGAFAVGIGYFAGSSPQYTRTADKPAEVNFTQGDNYAPGSNPLSRPAQQGSSIDLFRQVNKNYSTETSAPGSGIRQAVKVKNPAQMQEFIQQVRHNINYESSPQSAMLNGVQPGGEKRVYNPAGLRGKPGAATAVRTTLPRLKTSGADAGSGPGGHSTFQVNLGDSGAPPALHGAAAARQQHAADVANRNTSGSGEGSRQGQSAGGQGGGSGTGLNAGAYGSHGGGGGAAAASSAGAMAPAQTESKPPPAPVAYLWPRISDFGDMRTYETATRLVILMNIGELPLAVGAIENIDDSAPFHAEEDKCSNATLAPGKSCTFHIRFSPQSAKDHITAFYVPTNDEGSSYYQTYMEVKGKASNSQWTSWMGSHLGNASQGRVNRADFGMVPEGRSLSQTIRVTNTGGTGWYALKLDTSKLPASFKISGDGCTGTSVGPGDSCAVTVTFTPAAAVNRRFADSHYGQYLAVNTTNGAKVYDSRPKFPPLLMDSPVEASPAGEFAVLASYNDEYYTAHQEVLSVPVAAKSCAPFPAAGLTRIQNYYYFR